MLCEFRCCGCNNCVMSGKTIQDGTQPVTPDLEPAIILTLQQIMQLASAHPRLSQSNLTHEAHHLQPLCMALVSDPIALVVSLPAYPQKQASPDDGQLLDLPLREDLPGRFFTMETP